MNLLISSCLLGENVKYNGLNNKIDSSYLDSILLEHTIFPFCPEVEGGLPVPREASEITSLNPLVVKNINDTDVTSYFLLGANKALELCKEHHITMALLKSKSPSCGNIQIYDGTFSGVLIEESGVTAALLKKNGIRVFNEEQLAELYEALNQST